ncbi:class I alpha-mannosidase 1A [Metarhizium album ARSEF 1941]|uniref:alpha-1,2-Mannosidase n=1 Tax=Metarhizium album (strain ARSEF 1941) TaxID=1081103 RepID=A0A0B2X3T5_METAS|nr:class I alpha-mannosidase 1A [Metarhizium album ARSEF 1941]KHO01014.1 class I alpha-mannosidase 1A [Metarhizium album ARSEF 1941]
MVVLLHRVLQNTWQPGRVPEARLYSDSAVKSHLESAHEDKSRGHSTSGDTPSSTSRQFSLPTKVPWTKPKERFPLPRDSIIALPTGTANKIPRIQHVFSPEAEGPRKKRLQRQAMVQGEIRRSWTGYRKHAWMHDELMPVSNRSRDPFCGWSATLVDSLDTLWIASLKDEFDEAAKAAGNIDFTHANVARIPVFETTIRYLGGLIAAYDVSGGASGGYSFLLDKAVELADVLMGVFDTPNRMPRLFYYWQPEHTSRPAARPAGAIMAELATLSMEFTRLAQLTAQHKYYDAIDRITNGLIELQNAGTAIPGLFPENLDISGCNRTATEGQSKAPEAQVDSEVPPKAPQGHDPGEVATKSTGPGGRVKLDDRLERRAPPPLQQHVDAALPAFQPPTVKSRPNLQVPLGAGGAKSELDCVPQPPVSVSKYHGHEKYHMGGGQDSAYEYFGKEYLLLGGKEPKYQKLYENAIDSINKYLLFRPMVQGDWDVMFPAKVTLAPHGASAKVEYEVTHLTCFIGGMYALGGKLFGREKDLQYAKKLTDGCVWAYQSTATGIMPEYGQVIPCPGMEKCSFNESLWRQQLDPVTREQDKEIPGWEKYRSSQHGRSGSHSLQHQTAHMEKERRTGGLDTLSGDDGDNGSRRGTRNPGSPSTSLSDKSDVLEKRAASSDESEDVAPTSSDGTSSQSRRGKESGPGGEKPTKPSKSDESSDAPSVNIPTLKEDTGSQPPSIPYNRPPHADHAPKQYSHEEVVQERIRDGTPRGYSSVSNTKYILRPEAIESVWYMYRITGDPSWMEKGWAMFEATMEATRAPQANSAIDNVLRKDHLPLDGMESFWIAETLKYYYLLFSEPGVISLDEWVLNTEAHPFKL